jgi:hypothetical protein
MERKYVEENQEIITKMIDAMAPVFKENELLRKSAPIQSDQVAVAQKKEKLFRYGMSFTQEGEKFVYNYIVVLKDYLIKKYQIDRFTAEKEATDIVCLHVLKEIFLRNDTPFLSTYEQYIKKRELYALLKGISFILLIVTLAIVIILQL